MKDGIVAQGSVCTILIILLLLLIPFIFSSFYYCHASSTHEDPLKSNQVVAKNPIFIAGKSQYFDIILSNHSQKIRIVAYHGDSLPQKGNRSIENFYQWEYENDSWKDISGYEISYITESKCLKDNNTYSFYISLDRRALPGQWTIKIFVNNEKISTVSSVIVMEFNLFISILCCVCDPFVKDRKFRHYINHHFYVKSKPTGLNKNIEHTVDKLLEKTFYNSQQEKLTPPRELGQIFNSDKLNDDVFNKEEIRIDRTHKHSIDNLKNFPLIFIMLIAIMVIVCLFHPFMHNFSSESITHLSNITILNPQSYPPVGGNWTVMFKTEGQADLIITAINGTGWSNQNDNFDLQFLTLRQSNETMQYQWINNSIVIEDYTSTEIGYKVSMVLTPGIHVLLFRFGDTTAIARNLASEYWLQTTTSDFNNGTKYDINVSNHAFHLNETYYLRNTTQINNESFEGTWPPSGWSATGRWNKESNQVHSEDYSADFDGGWNFGAGFSGNLVSPTINCSDANVTAIYINFWTYENGADDGEYYLDYYNGSNWNQISRLDNIGSGSWAQYIDKISDLQYLISNFQIRWRVAGLDLFENVYVDDVIITLETNESGYHTEGNLVSEPHDTSKILPIYSNIILNSDIPDGTSITPWVRAADTELNLTAALWYENINLVPHKRWVQWRINLTGDQNHTPTIYDVNLTWGYDVETPNSYINAIPFYWQNLAPLEITASASDNETGIKEVALYYNFSSDNNSGWSGWLKYGINGTITPYNWSFTYPLGDGYYRFYSIAVDNSLNREDAPSQPGYDIIAAVDRVKPTSILKDIIPYRYNETTTSITVDISSATDNLSGLKNILLYYRHRRDNLSLWGSWELFAADNQAPWSWSFNFPKARGYYQFYSIAVDNASNYEDQPIFPDNDTECFYNSTKPYSEVDDILPHWQNNSPLIITSQATDFNGSGLHNVTLYYYYSDDNSSWSTPNTYGVIDDPWNEISWNFSFPNGEGHYRFYSSATDNVSNIEEFTGNDTICGYDITPPTSQVDSIVPYWYNASNTSVAITVTSPSDNRSGVSNISLFYRYRYNNGSSWDLWAFFGKDEYTPWSWLFDFPEGEGHYQFYSMANDTAGNTENPPLSPVYDAMCGYDISMPTSYVNTITPFTVVYTPLKVSATANDEVKNVTLWYRWNTDNTSWGPIPNGDVITIDNISSSEDASVSSITWIHTIGNYNNRTLIVCSAVEDSNFLFPVDHWSITGITYNNSPLIKAESEMIVDAGLFYDYASSEIWYIHNPDVGAHNISVQYTGVVDYISVGAISVYNISQTSPEDTNANEIRLASSISTNANSISRGNIIIDVVACGDSRTFTQGINQTEFFDRDTAGSGGAGSYKIFQSTGLTTMSQTASSSANRMAHVVVSFAPTVSNECINWTRWGDITNPDSSAPWDWNFDFPNETGYYQFYSIARDNFHNAESPPLQKDAFCYYNPSLSTPPYINSYDLINITGSKLNNATGLLDINKEYMFTINITDLNGWEDIEYVEIKAWYDNGSDSTVYNQTIGGNLNMHVRYENTSGTSQFSLLWPDDEVQIILGNCTEKFIDENKKIINISFKPLNQIRWADSLGTWDGTPDIFNDPYSWNFNITVIDKSGSNDMKKNEYGVYRFTSIVPDQDWVDVVAPPGFFDSSNIVTITYSSNYDFNMTIYFEEDLYNDTLGSTIPIANNVYILADADLNDDISTDMIFSGIGEGNSIGIFNDSGFYQKDNISQTVNVQFQVYIPFGTPGVKYTAKVATKIIQD